MEIIARTENVRISPRKVRLVADAVRSMRLSDAISALSVMEKRGGYVLEKTLSSAVANAQGNPKIDVSTLRIKSIIVNEGTFLKRFKPSTRGRVHPYKKRATNIRVVLEGEEKK